MLATRLFLAFSALVWLPYGIFCFFQPSFLNEAAGLLGTSPTATTEIRAMYGGLEAGIGAFCVWALVRPELARSALLMLCFTCGGLALTRTAGLVLDQSASGYTFGGLAFEVPSTIIAIILVRRLNKGAA